MNIFKLLILVIFTQNLSCANKSIKTSSLENGLKVSKIASDAYVLTDQDFYNSNVLVVKTTDDTAVIVSSPFENIGTETMMRWIQKNLQPKKMVAINPHFHRDGTGGNAVYKKYGAETWSSDFTKKLRFKSNKRDPVKSAAFYTDPIQKQKIINSPALPADNKFDISFGKKFFFSGEEVQVFFPGPAHSPDNSVVYFPKQKILFGGCMIKPKSLGYLGDADIKSWPESARKLLKFDVTTVIPGHGKWGGKDLISKTVDVAEKAIEDKKVKLK